MTNLLIAKQSLHNVIQYEEELKERLSRLCDRNVLIHRSLVKEFESGLLLRK